MVNVQRDAYTNGFEAAVSHLRGIIQAWVEDKSRHGSCICPACDFLRVLASATGSWRPLMKNGRITQEDVHGHVAGYRAGIALLQIPLKLWVDMHETHSECACSSCRELRLIAAKRYEHPFII
ncbi:MAG: hypothetical protein LLG06_10765 [Desulfobacteraceae bacterium]|nr:hypothetical protein [Desulfobacteraceae bacterium]